MIQKVHKWYFAHGGRMAAFSLTISLVISGTNYADGWRSIGPSSGPHSRVVSIAFDPSDYRIYATTDSGLIKRTGDSSWMTVWPNFCYHWPGYSECYYHKKIWKHPYIENVWFLGTDVSAFEPGEVLYRASSPEGPWQTVHSGMFLGTHFNLTFRPDTVAKLYANLESFAVSNDTGTSWYYPIYDAFFGAPFISIDEQSPYKVYTAGYLSSQNLRGVFRSTNDGVNWSLIWSSDIWGLYSGSCLVRNDTILIAFASWTDSGYVVFSSNGGNSWSRPIENKNIYSLLRHPEYPQIIFAGGVGEILISTDGGQSWTMYNNTLPQFRINQLTVTAAPDTIFAATYGAGIIQVYDFAVGVEEPSHNVPEDFMLYPAFPNPFNPSTTISFDIPKRSHTTLEVFNLLAQRMLTLVNGEREAGRHSVVLDTGSWPSGSYLVRLNAGGRSLTRRIVLLK